MGIDFLVKKNPSVDAWQKAPTQNSTDKIWMNDPSKAWNQKKLHMCDIENEEIPTHLGFFDVVGNSIEFRQICHQAVGMGKFPRSMGHVPQRLSLWSQKKDFKEKSHVVPLFHRVKITKKHSETMDVTCCFLEIYRTLTFYLLCPSISFRTFNGAPFPK